MEGATSVVCGDPPRATLTVITTEGFQRETWAWCGIESEGEQRAVESISLEGEIWHLGTEIGSGGFARVHDAVSPHGEPAVLKLIPKDPGAERELLLEELSGVPNVIPILATGERDNDWVLAMPRADMSLREFIGKRGALELAEAVAVLRDIATALQRLESHVVHRDLKPENVLWWRGSWHLADFGIARYAEQTTAIDTRKFAMTAASAAPEQWNFERSTGATDVYALGIIAYEMLSGRHPFPGPETEDFREQHLEWPAPALDHVPPDLASVVAACLMKPAEARPRPSDLLARLDINPSQPTGAAARLQRINLLATQRAAEESAAAEAERIRAKRRQALYAAADETLTLVRDMLREQLLKYLPDAAATGWQRWPFELNGARLEWQGVSNAASTDWGHYPPKFEVIAYATIGIRIPPDRHGYIGRAHSIWYCDAQTSGSFRWFETAFMIMPLASQRTRGNPVSLSPGSDAGEAVSRVIGMWQVAWPFTPIDQGESADFVERWLEWYADAAEGRLRHPTHMPERDPKGSYRN